MLVKNGTIFLTFLIFDIQIFLKIYFIVNILYYIYILNQHL